MIEKSSLSSKRDIHFPMPSAIMTIGIIADNRMKFNFKLKSIAKNSELTFLLFDPDKRPKEKSDEVIYVSDLNFWRVPKFKMIDSFVSKPFDILINLMLPDSDAAQYVCAKSIARFKVGRTKNGRVYDLIIDRKEMGIAEFLDEIERTISNFNSTT